MMKKISLLALTFLLTSCTVIGFFQDPSSYDVTFYSNDPYLVSSEYITENSKPKNEVLTAYRGYTVIDNKMYLKQRFQNDELRASSDVVLSGPAYPIRYTKNQRVVPAGEIHMSDGKYIMIPADLPDYYVLINPMGEIHDQIGSYRNSRLTILDGKYYATPRDFRFESVSTSKSTQSLPTKGFDVKYSGINSDRMVFTYFDYSTADKKAGYFEDITFPLNQDVVEIDGFGIKILKADAHKLEYMILR